MHLKSKYTSKRLVWIIYNRCESNGGGNGTFGVVTLTVSIDLLASFKLGTFVYASYNRCSLLLIFVYLYSRSMIGTSAKK